MKRRNLLKGLLAAVIVPAKAVQAVVQERPVAGRAIRALQSTDDPLAKIIWSKCAHEESMVVNWYDSLFRGDNAPIKVNKHPPVSTVNTMEDNALAGGE